LAVGNEVKRAADERVRRLSAVEESELESAG